MQKIAKSLLILGFCKEVIDQIECASLREEIEVFSKAFLKEDVLK